MESDVVENSMEPDHENDNNDDDDEYVDAFSIYTPTYFSSIHNKATPYHNAMSLIGLLGSKPKAM